MAHRKSVRVAGIAVAAVIPMALAACSSSSSSSSSSPARAAPVQRLQRGQQRCRGGQELQPGARRRHQERRLLRDDGVRRQAEAKTLGVNLTVTGPADFSAPEQAPILNAVAASKPDALIVAPTDTKALNPELTRIAERGREGRLRGHHDDRPVRRGLAHHQRQHRRRQARRGQPGHADRRQGHRGRHQREPGHQHHGRADRRLHRGDEGQVPEHHRARDQYDNDSSATAASQVSRPTSPPTPTCPACSRPTCSARRARPPAYSTRARRAR